MQLDLKVGVVVGTFGDPEKWYPLAARAMASAEAAGADKLYHCHSDTLQHARNIGAKMVGTEWLIFLDADDELDEGYIDAMLKGEGDIRKPATIGVYPDGSEDDAPTMIPTRDLNRANHIVIGAMCRAEIFWRVEGFRDYPVLEDWDLWRRMCRAGAVVGEVSGAVYRVHVNPDSRNSNQALHDKVYQQIRRSK